MSAQRLAAVLLLLLLPLGAGAEPRPERPVGAPPELRDPWGRRRTLSEVHTPVLVVAFMGASCPASRRLAPVLVALQRDLQGKGAQVIAIHPQPYESLEAIAGSAERDGLPFPSWKDVGGQLARENGINRTPAVLVFDRERKLRHRGPGIPAARAEREQGEGLEATVRALLEGTAPEFTEAPVDGCQLEERDVAPPSGPIDWATSIAPLIQSRCGTCHREGGVGPFPLNSHADLLRHAAMVREVVVQRRMPPWSALPAEGVVGERRLTEEEMTRIAQFVEQGAPRGTGEEPQPEPLPAWRIGEPDAVFRLPKPERIPPRGDLDYRWVAIPTAFKQERWVQAAEIRPGQRSVVHHATVHVVEGRARSGQPVRDTRGAALAAWAPGDMPTHYPEGTALRLPPGATLVFELHYTPDGTERHDSTEVGVLFAKQPPEREVRRDLFTDIGISIPPGEPLHELETSLTLREDVRLLSLLPHMHLRGRSFEYAIEVPGQERRVLLSVPRYDFAWQAMYGFEPALALPRGTRLFARARWDNSALNLSNPDPAARVRFGQRTTDEMMVGWVTYSVPRKGHGRR